MKDSRKGAAHHNAKLTEQDVRDAREAYENGALVGGKPVRITVSALAERYGVTPQAMGRAVKRKNWRHVS